MPAKNKDGFGSFIDPKGCFRRSENPAKEKPRNSQNVNAICVNFCAEENITYAATISDRCLCLNSLPSEKLEDNQCSTPCPGKKSDQCVTNFLAVQTKKDTLTITPVMKGLTDKNYI